MRPARRSTIDVMTAMLVLQGGGPFVANDDLDRRVLAAAGVERIVMLPTADAFEQPQEMVDAALAWGSRLGVAVEPLMVITRDQAGDEAAAVVNEAPAVFLAGDSSIHLRSVLKDTPLFAAIAEVLDRDGLVIAAGPSAEALCDPMTDQRGGAFALGLGLVPGMAVIAGIEAWPKQQIDRAHHLADTPVADLPTGSALIRSADGWEIVGDAVVHGELPA
jgi:cyanophycinase